MDLVIVRPGGIDRWLVDIRPLDAGASRALAPRWLGASGAVAGTSVPQHPDKR